MALKYLYDHAALPRRRHLRTTVRCGVSPIKISSRALHWLCNASKRFSIIQNISAKFDRLKREWYLFQTKFHKR
jgi:hypothetical protein